MNDTQMPRWTNKGSWQRYMIGYLLAYLAISLLLLAALGPVGLSKTYLEEYEADHDRYIETTKLDSYKRWRQRRELNPPDDDLAVRFAFVDEYRARPEFIGEQHRRTIYAFLIDIFKVAMVIILVLHFGRKPLRELLKGMIENVRNKMGQAQEERDSAARRKHEALAKLDGLPAQQTDIEAQTAERIKEMRREDALTVGSRLANLNRETEDRQRHEETLARLELKQELVNQAIDVLAERFRQQTAQAEGAILIDQFVQQLEEGR